MYILERVNRTTIVNHQVQFNKTHIKEPFCSLFHIQKDQLSNSNQLNPRQCQYSEKANLTMKTFKCRNSLGRKVHSTIKIQLLY